MAIQTTPYPATLSIDYPDRELNRLTSFFRIFTSIPILIVLSLLVGVMFESKESGEAGWRIETAASGFVVFPILLMILFRQKYPKWWFDWNLALNRFKEPMRKK